MSCSPAPPSCWSSAPCGSARSPSRSSRRGRPMNQMIGLLVVAGALPLLWLALRSPRSGDELDEHGNEVPVWADAARRGDLTDAVDLHDVMLQMKTVPRLVKPVMERFGRAVQRFTPGGIGSSLDRSIYL